MRSQCNSLPGLLSDLVPSLHTVMSSDMLKLDCGSSICIWIGIFEEVK